MFESFEMQDGTPRDIRRFELLWMLAIASSAVMAMGMYDYSEAIVGNLRALAVNVALFAVAAVLMVAASRRRSNLARWLTVPFLVLIAFYDLAHFEDMEGQWLIIFFAAAGLALMVAAIRSLFTPRSRAWFAGTPLAPGGADDDWS